MIADGIDVFAVCAFDAQEPSDAVLRVAAPSGELVAEDKLLEVHGYMRTDVHLGYNFSAAEARTVFVESDSSLVPVGYRWQYGGGWVTTIYFQLPVNRGSGTWVATYTGSDSLDHNYELESAACGDGLVEEVWSADPGLDVYTFWEQQAWSERRTVEDFVVPNHCRAAPLLLGRSAEEAANALEAALGRFENSRSADWARTFLRCDPESDEPEVVVSGQTPAPYADLLSRVDYSLDFEGRCGSVPDVSGKTVRSAMQQLENTDNLADLPVPLVLARHDSCIEDDSIVTLSFPGPGLLSASGPEIRIHLHCE